MVNVLFLGRSDRRLEAWAKAHARVIKKDNGNVIFLALYGENYSEDNFTFVNCHNISQIYTVTDIQNVLPGSINRILACDRSITDYTWSTSYYIYSRNSTRKIAHLVEVMGNGILQNIKKIDYCVDGLFDNFISPLGLQIARQFGVPFYMIRTWQYWHDCFHVVDSPGYESSIVNGYYPRYYRRVTEAMYPRVMEEFSAARFSRGAFAREGWRFRLQIVRDKWRSYERPSLRNFLVRRTTRFAAVFLARWLRYTTCDNRPNRYIVFALHVAPEAAILGTDPDVADQFSLIRRMSLHVPFGVEILCKAHPGDKFGRDLEIGFLRGLCSLHNVSLVPESEGIDSFLNDEKCLAIATINGSVALDAVSQNKPCFIFGKGIFAIATCFLKPQNDDEFFEQIMSLINGDYSIDKVALAAIILSMKRATLKGGVSLKEQNGWLDCYSSLLPAIHDFHQRSAKLTVKQ